MLQKTVIRPPFSCFTRSRGPATFRYMTVHLYPPTHTHVIQTHLLPPTEVRVRCLSAIIALTANPPTFFCLLHYHPVTNIYTAKEGVVCVITVCVQEVSASEASFLAPPGRREGRGGVKAQMASAQTRQPQSRAAGMSHAQVTRQQLGNTRKSNE